VPLVSGLAVLLFMYAMLLLPKLLGAFAILRSGVSMAALGGPAQFALSMLTEIVLSVAYAPVIMVQQTLAVGRAILGRPETWRPQRRARGGHRLSTLLRTHWVETLIGAGLVAGMATGFVSLWLLPIAASLALAVPLSALSGLSLGGKGWAARQMGTEENFAAPDIILAARHHRAEMRRALADPAEAAVIAAE
jgi:membrane glycosyltransferase